MRLKKNIGLVLIVASAVLWSGSAHGQDAYYFAEPNGWSPGDVNSTYQEWDVLMLSADNKPDFGYVTNPGGLPEPNLSVLAPGFVSGSANFYSFSGDYGVTADLYNHGGSSGGGVPPGCGTHVIVQTAATLHPDYNVGVFAGSLRLVDPNGQAITGGGNAEALRIDEIWTGVVSSSWGDVTQQELIWEFFLPNYTDDFHVLADVVIHSMFRQIRVDSITAAEAYGRTPIPGPFDVDQDGDVDFVDYALFAGHWLATGCGAGNNWCSGAEFNRDGNVNADDLADFMAHWLEGSVPE